MASLERLKDTLRRIVEPARGASLSTTQYHDYYEAFLAGAAGKTYEDFIIPELSRVFETRLKSRENLTVLEIGPGPKSVLERLCPRLRERVDEYTAYEPNPLFAEKLQASLSSEDRCVFANLQRPVDIRRTAFEPHQNVQKNHLPSSPPEASGTYDMILFCHSLYGMASKAEVIRDTISKLLTETGLVIVFHRHVDMGLEDLVSHDSVVYSKGIASVIDHPPTLGYFASFVVGIDLGDTVTKHGDDNDWIRCCRSLGTRTASRPNELVFAAPEVMLTFSRQATALSALTAQLPAETVFRRIKNTISKGCRPATIIRPDSEQQVQIVVQWAIEHHLGLTILGGSHSDHCVMPAVVAVDMSAFDGVDVIRRSQTDHMSEFDAEWLLIAGAGCNNGDIIRMAAKHGLSVPIGSRPSVGIGSWLQGGLGHSTRSRGLTCDSIVGAVIVSVTTDQLLYVGDVPQSHVPTSAIRSPDEADILWSLKGAGTGMFVVVQLVFATFPAAKFEVWKWILPQSDVACADSSLQRFESEVANNIPESCSADAYLYSDNGKMYLGVTLFECSLSTSPHRLKSIDIARTALGHEHSHTVANDESMFDQDMYCSELHGGHQSGKTSSFKRCVFLSRIAGHSVAQRLAMAIEERPTPLCYIHLMHGRGVAARTLNHETAFGSRDWNFACVITGVWRRDQDGTADAAFAIKWVHDLVSSLLRFAEGIYNADLGPCQEDFKLACHTFGCNRRRLGQLKAKYDPYNVLRFSCPLSSDSSSLIVLISGKHGAGKDYCAAQWSVQLDKHHISNRVVSISEATKREYASRTAADIDRLLNDRSYKEDHRTVLNEFYAEQVRDKPDLPRTHFLELAKRNSDVDVLLVTGIRDEAPVAKLANLVPASKLIEIHIVADEGIRARRRGCKVLAGLPNAETPDLAYRPDLVFTNQIDGPDQARDFAESNLLPFLTLELDRLRGMVRCTQGFPAPGATFHDILGICRHRGGLDLCVSLLHQHIQHKWPSIEAIISPECGGWLFAAPLACRTSIPLHLVRERRRLPHPTAIVPKNASYISSITPQKQSVLEIECDYEPISSNSKVVIIDDVLSTGSTVHAVIQLLLSLGLEPGNITILVVAELPLHKGRELLYHKGCGRVMVHSLLVFEGL